MAEANAEPPPPPVVKLEIQGKIVKGKDTRPKEISREDVQKGLESGAFRKGPPTKKGTSEVWLVSRPLLRKDESKPEEENYDESGYQSNKHTPARPTSFARKDK